MDHHQSPSSSIDVSPATIHSLKPEPHPLFILRYAIFFLFGISTLVSWNAWITVPEYFSERLAGSIYQENFMNYVSIPNLFITPYLRNFNSYPIQPQVFSYLYHIKSLWPVDFLSVYPANTYFRSTTSWLLFYGGYLFVGGRTIRGK